MVLKKTLESPSDSKEIKPVYPKGNQSWIARTDAEAETPILWTPDAMKNWLIGKDPMLGKIEGRRRRGQQRMTCLDGIMDSLDMSLRKLQEMVKDRKAWHAQSMELHGVGHDWVIEQERGPTVQHREFCSILCGSLDGSGVLENGYMYMYGWVHFLSTWNYHNNVNQLYSNIK